MKLSDISETRLDELNSGMAETSHLTECLAVDFVKLMNHIFPEYACSFETSLGQLKNGGITKRVAMAAEMIVGCEGMRSWQVLAEHPSDTVRGWACFMVGCMKDWSLETCLDQIKVLADDHHFGVREWAWLALRNRIIQEPEKAIFVLTKWTSSPSQNIRRFASEATRPRGVWCAHFEFLKHKPEHALSLLTPLKSDSHRYVQDSVANWLNDASKTRPDWVKELCQSWISENNCSETSYICKRAQRSM